MSRASAGQELAVEQGGGARPPARNAIFQLPTNTLMNDNGLLIEGTRAAPRRLTASAPVESPG